MIEIVDNTQPVNTFLSLDEGDMFKALNNELFMKIEEENFKVDSANACVFLMRVCVILMIVTMYGE